jgi:hypothetical protein
MRGAAALLALSALIPATALAAGPVEGPHTPGARPASHCPRITSYFADKSGLFRGQPLMPRKLTELPPGTAYMAVYRRIGGCEAPLTMADYRNPRRQ